MCNICQKELANPTCLETCKKKKERNGQENYEDYRKALTELNFIQAPNDFPLDYRFSR
jgi:hypothetical protein